jgi:O-antigen ligase
MLRPDPYNIFKRVFAGNNTWEILLVLSLAFSILFSLISISLVQVFLALALVFWIVLLIRRERKYLFPSFFWPLLAYSALSLMSSAFSVNVLMSFTDCRKMLLFLIVPIVYTAYRKKEELDLAVFALLASAFASTIYSLVYYVLKASPGQRVKGFMGHYMTQAGILALFGSFALGLIFFGRGKWRIAWAAGLVLSGLASILTLTRSGWIGLAVGLCVILLIWKPKTIILVPVAAGLLFFVSPQAVKNRAKSIFSLQGYSNWERIAYLKAGIEIIKDYPLFGTGPDTVDMVYQNPKYGLDESAKRNVHLHSNFTQIAAERGIVTLAAWLAFLIWAFVSLIKRLKTKDPSIVPLAAGSLAALAALFVSGLFEYNFGDSEVTTLFLFLLAAPFALERVRS